MKESIDKYQKFLAEIDDIMRANPAEALAQLEDFRQKLDADDPDLSNEIDFKLAQAKDQTGDFEGAEPILKMLLKKYKDKHDANGLVRITNELGNNYWSRGILNKSLEYYLQSLNILEEREDFSKMCVPLNNIGQIYWYNKDFAKARDSYCRSLELANEYKPEVSGDALLNLGILSAEEGDFQQAVEFYKRALTVYTDQNYRANIPVIQVNLALLYEDTDQDDLAVEYHQKALQSFREAGNRFGEMHVLMNYAGFLIARKKFTGVPEILDNASTIAEELDARNQIIQLYLHYRDYYHGIGDIAHAYKYFEKFHDAEIDRLDMENREKLTEMLTKYETAQKEKEAKMLRSQNELLEKKNIVIEEKSQALDLANRKLQKANLELEHRLENIINKWHEQEMVNRGSENLGGFNVILSNIAHQWKQPLNAVVLMIQNLQDAYEFGELDSDFLEKFHDQIYQQIKYMSNIIDNFAYNLRDSDERSDFSLQHALKLSTMLLEKTLEMESITLINDIKNDFHIPGNESQFIQVLMVLLSNAVEVFQSHTQENALIELAAEVQADKLVFEVSDNGQLIPEDVLPHIFDVFYSTKSKKNNTGLGLTLAKKIIKEKFNGKIECYNRKNWVVFRIILPFNAKSEKS
ncbi:MAG: tetratricopeptide repeat-containing sensor histidine kinase [Candidatus Cloacimonetes bacterium]|nr:tetratricopeptide repeat-containing sensor histidine kinase [Candidatus Cloacimonadota bacterium]